VGSTVPAILFSPFASTSVYLMGLDGQKLHEWTTAYAPGYSVYLLPDGRLLRATSLPERPFSALQGSNGGRVEMLGWDSAVLWRFDYASTSGQQHHDVFWMPNNGHVLMVAWEGRSSAEAIAAGRDPSTLPESGELWVDKIVEVDPATNRIVWEWRTWDHLLPPGAAPAEHPGLVDPNYVTPGTDLVDWTHANAVFYNEALDQVMLSVRNFSEFWIIDHSTTTAQAAGHTGGRLGHGGDLIYRWGNPRAYGLAAPQQLFGQHNAQWIAPGLPGAGHVLVFNNGDAKRGPTRRSWSSCLRSTPTAPTSTTRRPVTVRRGRSGSTWPARPRACSRPSSPAPSACPAATPWSPSAPKDGSWRSRRTDRRCGRTS